MAGGVHGGKGDNIFIFFIIRDRTFFLIVSLTLYDFMYLTLLKQYMYVCCRTNFLGDLSIPLPPPFHLYKPTFHLYILLGEGEGDGAARGGGGEGVQVPSHR